VIEPNHAHALDTLDDELNARSRCRLVGCVR